MEFQRGRVVHATAGRDKGGFFVVLQVSGDFALICDGKRRPLEKPKKKKLLHLSLTGTVLPDGSIKTNREIRKALQPLVGAG